MGEALKTETRFPIWIQRDALPRYERLHRVEQCERARELLTLG